MYFAFEIDNLLFGTHPQKGSLHAVDGWDVGALWEHTEDMEFSRVLPSDAPDPAVESETRLRDIFFPVMELRPQRAVSRLPITGFSETRGADGVEESSVLMSYTLWRFPDDRADPRNEVEMDDATRQALEEEPAWERPAWLIEQTRLFRYPMLWEAVRTSWCPSLSHPSAALSTQISQHANHILRNVFRRELDLPAAAGDDHRWELDTASVTPGTVTVDGHSREGAQIESHPHIYAMGYCVNEHVICTTVISRDALPHLQLELTTLTH